MKLSEKQLHVRSLAGSKGFRSAAVSQREHNIQCGRRCACHCHHRYSIISPLEIRHHAGKFDIQWQNVSWWRPSCNIRGCQRNARSSVVFQYTLPTKFFTTMISAWYLGAPMLSSTAFVDFVPIFPSECFSLVQQGVLDGLNDLYSGNAASINQVCPFDGYNALMVSQKQH